MVLKSSYDLINYLPVSIIKEWLWCPVIAWFEVLSIPEPLPNHAVEYEVYDPYEVTEEFITYLRKEPKYVLLKPRLRSKSLGIKGVPDAVIVFSDEAVVIEFKTTSSWVLNDHVKLQVSAYALMTKEVLGTSVRAFIVSKLGYFEVNWVREVPKLLKVISEIRKVITKEYIPEPNHLGIRCRSCPYSRICRWRPNA